MQQRLRDIQELAINNRVWLVIASLAIAVVAVIWIRPGTNIAERVDVVNGVRPASTALHGIHGYAEELARLPEAERAAYLQRERPRLEQGVVYYLRHDVRRLQPTQQVDHVEFFFGSLNHVTADDGEGIKHTGYFKDQLVARVYLADGTGQPIDVLVKCLNCWFVLPGQVEQLQSLGAARVVEVFTIERGWGLTRYVDYPVAIDIAERFNLPLYRGKAHTEQHRISSEEARRLEYNTDRVQVTVHVIEGDKFDLINMTFTPSPLRQKS